MAENYVKLGDLEVYKKALNLSRYAWKIYERMTWQDKKILGDQFITAIDSTGANIAEGYGRFHYLDRIKFYYNSRGSLLEVKHWVLLLLEREKIGKEEYEALNGQIESLHYSLNSFIKGCYPKK